MVYSSLPFREAVSSDARESLVFAADNLAQFTLAQPGVACKCDRALPCARPNDIVVLRHKPDQDYMRWLKSLGLGANHIVSYDRDDKPLSRLIIENPSPVHEKIQKIGKQPVYVPWFSGKQESDAAKAIGAKLFGARTDLTWHYNDKAAFKSLCHSLNIPVADDIIVENLAENRATFTDAVKYFLSSHKVALVRAALDNTGVSLVFKTQPGEIDALFDNLVRLQVKKVLVEPFLDVAGAPNDQWIITRDGDIHHMGQREQTCEDGTHHIATLMIPNQPCSQPDKVFSTSKAIIKEMAKSGYVGVAGIDYITTASGDLFPVENNARFNGSSYVTLTIDALSEKGNTFSCWKFKKVNTRPCTFADLEKRLGSMLYSGTQKAAVFPYNCEKLNETGTFSIIILTNDPEAIIPIEEKLSGLGVL